ncbi:hypothetical protein CPT_Madawaska_209 [Staphylococcus phage Madawaska]|nr:hypothetical protein CPT_Madawaska_209 [Staphylococcus phage Madawaska]
MLDINKRKITSERINLNLGLVEDLLEEMNFNILDDEEFELAIRQIDNRYIVESFNYLKSEGLDELLKDVLVNNKNNLLYSTESLINNRFHEYLTFVKRYNEDNEKDSIINDFLKINVYNRIEFRIDLFKFSYKNILSDIDIFLLILFGKEFYHEYRNKYNKSNINTNNKSLRNLIVNTSESFRYYENESSYNKVIDKDKFVDYLNTTVKSYIVTLFRVFENENIIMDESLLYTFIYKMNYSKIRKFIYDIDDGNIEIKDIRREYKKYLPEKILI